MIASGLIVIWVALAQGVFGVANHGGTWWFTTPDGHARRRGELPFADRRSSTPGNHTRRSGELPLAESQPPNRGNLFWSFAVDCVDQGETKNEWKVDNPGFASFRLYDSPKQWAETTTQNLRDWGFNSLGGWSDYDDLERLDPSGKIPFFVVLHLGAYAQAPFHDIFAPAAQTAMRNAARDQIPKLRDNPDLVGYFTDNELGWWGDTLFISYLAMPNDAPGKQRLMRVIRRFYKDDFARLQKEWITGADSFEALAKEGKMKLQPGGHGIDLVNAWLTEMATYYYAFVRDAVRAYDKSHLILGDRYCQFYEIPIAQASRPYTDVTSTNFGATWNDGTFAHFFLDGLYKLTGHPIVVSEFYMGATENRSGNKNTPAAFPLVQTQSERAKAYLANVRSLAALPYVIGAHWFQYYDEPPKGRGDGENFNHGLVDTQGRPYDLMVAASQQAKPAQVHAPAPPLFSAMHRAPKMRGAGGVRLPIPTAPPDPLKDLKLWPRNCGFIPPDKGLDFADLYVCRDADALYLGTIAMDYADPHLYEGDKIPEGERMEWTIHLGNAKTIHIGLGGDDQKAISDDPEVQLSEVHGLQHVCLARIPFKLNGATLNISSSISTHSRGYTMSWREKVGTELAETSPKGAKVDREGLVLTHISASTQTSALASNPRAGSLSRSEAVVGEGGVRVSHPRKSPLILGSGFEDVRLGKSAPKWPHGPRSAICNLQPAISRKSKIQNLKSATRFRVVDDHGVDWLVAPDGQKLLSRGVCVVDRGATPKTFDNKNPGYAAYRYYLSPQEWATDTLDRLQNWGFNTVGAWSDTATLIKPGDPNMLFTPILHMGSGAGAPWRDMWDPKIFALMEDIARKQIEPLKGENRIVGYFSDNEMGWWYGAMWDWAFRAGVHSRAHLVGLLQTRYDSWPKLLKDFDPAGATNFQDLKTKGRLFLRPGQKGIETVKAWMSVVSDRYYRLCREIIKKYDPGALYLGDRYISNFYPEVAASAGKYCDVVSTNLNADTQDGAFAPFYLPALRAITKRPIMITEYYETSDDNRSGNQNNSSGFPVLPTQTGRAIAFKRQTETLLRTPYVVGAHWFQYYDEPMHGRGDGEDYDMGLVDIENRSYEQLTDASRSIDTNLIHRQGPVAKKPTVHIKVFSDASLNEIDVWINRGYLVPAAGLNTRGSLYLAQNRGHLYACLYWNEDLFPEAFYRSGKVPAADDAKLEILVNGQKTQVTIPATGAPMVKNGKAMLYKWAVRNYVILQLPGPVTTHVAASMSTRARAYKMAWR